MGYSRQWITKGRVTRRSFQIYAMHRAKNSKSNHDSVLLELLKMENRWHDQLRDLEVKHMSLLLLVEYGSEGVEMDDHAGMASLHQRPLRSFRTPPIWNHWDAPNEFYNWKTKIMKEKSPRGNCCFPLMWLCESISGLAIKARGEALFIHLPPPFLWYFELRRLRIWIWIRMTH